jgi:hypothetical protein
MKQNSELRNLAGECSLLFTWLATVSGRSFTIHASAYPRKKRCECRNLKYKISTDH